MTFSGSFIVVLPSFCIFSLLFLIRVSTWLFSHSPPIRSLEPCCVPLSLKEWREAVCWQISRFLSFLFPRLYRWKPSMCRWYKNRSKSDKGYSWEVEGVEEENRVAFEGYDQWMLYTCKKWFYITLRNKIKRAIMKVGTGWGRSRHMIMLLNREDN